MLSIKDEKEELAIFRKILSHDKDAIDQFYVSLNEVQKKALKVPTVAKMNAALKGKLSVFTHSNRLIEPRVETTTMGSYSNKGDVNAFTENLDSFVDLSGNAANSPSYQLMITEYLLDGCKTNLLQALQNGREVSSLFDYSIRKESFDFDIYDKRVFIPANGSYCVALPRTPAWRTIGVLNAQKSLFEQEIMTSKPSLKTESFALNTKLRVSEIMQGQNASYFTGKTGSQCHHSVFLPPSKHQPVIKRALKMIEKAGISEKSMLVLLKDVVVESGAIYSLAQQMHRVYASDDLKDKKCPDNAATRETFEKLGRMAYSAISLITEHDNEEGEFSSFIAQKRDDLAELSWTRVYYKLPKNYVFEGAKALFIAGFTHDDAVNESDKDDTPETSSIQATQKERKHEGSFLKLVIDVDGYDAGSNGFSLGPLQPVSIYGWLHNLLERNVGIKFKRFTPVYENIHLHDQACLKARDTTLISRKTYVSNDVAIDAAIQSGLNFDRSWLYVQEKTMSTRSGTGDRCGLSDKGEHNPSMRMDVQASAKMSIVIELQYALSSSQADTVIDKIMREIKKTKLNGGIIFTRSISVHAKEPRTKGFALKRKEVTSLAHWLKQISFVNKEYIGEVPTGLLAVGYDAVETVSEVTHRAETYPACVVETVYKGFSFVKSSNQDKAWFQANVDLSTNFYFSLIK